MESRMRGNSHVRFGKGRGRLPPPGAAHAYFTCATRRLKHMPPYGRTGDTSTSGEKPRRALDSYPGCEARGVM